MKVVEKDTDRTAEVHLHADGVIKHLDEYGEYVDPVDNAICCFVPVELGQKITVEGKFKGNAIHLHHDILVDNVCRKSVPFIGKAVSRANRSIGSDGFFYRTEHGTVESKLVVKPIYSDLDFDTNAPITIGTIEIRVYLLRRFDEEQSIQMQKFHECVDEGHDTAKPVGYNSIKPDYAMTFEKDLGEIELRIRNKAQKAMNTVRPGTAPWAIFRFHYRDRTSIDQNDKALTCHADWPPKKKREPRVLQIPVLPLLEIGTKPRDSASTRHSSVEPSLPDTPASKSRLSQPPTTPTTSTTARASSPDSTMSTSLFVGENEDLTGAGLSTQSKQSETDTPKTPNSKAQTAAPASPTKVKAVQKSPQVEPSPQAKEKEPPTNKSTADDSATSTEKSSTSKDTVGDNVKPTEKSTSERSGGGNMADKKDDNDDSSKETPKAAPRDPRIRNNPDLPESASVKKGPAGSTTSAKRANESSDSDTPAEKRTKLTELPDSMASSSATDTAKDKGDTPISTASSSSPAAAARLLLEKEQDAIEARRQISDLQKERRKIAERLKATNEILARNAPKLEQLLAKEKEEHDREAKELQDRLELLAYLESEGLMDTE